MEFMPSWLNLLLKTVLSFLLKPPEHGEMGDDSRFNHRRKDKSSWIAREMS